MYHASNTVVFWCVNKTMKTLPKPQLACHWGTSNAYIKPTSRKKRRSSRDQRCLLLVVSNARHSYVCPVQQAHVPTKLKFWNIAKAPGILLWKITDSVGKAGNNACLNIPYDLEVIVLCLHMSVVLHTESINLIPRW